MKDENKVEAVGDELRVRDILIDMLRFQPARAVARKTMSGNTTMAEMIVQLTNSEEEALMWATELLRISRDVVARRVESGGSLAPSKPLLAILLDAGKVQPLTPFAQIAREVPNTILWQSLKGNEMALAVETGSEVAQQWMLQVFCQCEVFIRAKSKGK